MCTGMDESSLPVDLRGLVGFALRIRSIGEASRVRPSKLRAVAALIVMSY